MNSKVVVTHLCGAVAVMETGTQVLECVRAHRSRGCRLGILCTSKLGTQNGK